MLRMLRLRQEIHAMARSFDPVGPDTDRAEAMRDLAELVRPYTAEDRLGAAFAAADRGHTVAWDPPAGLTSVRARWTCQRCGATVLRRPAGHLTGGALDRDCT
jgi:hypothetical protein